MSWRCCLDFHFIYSGCRIRSWIGFGGTSKFGVTLRGSDDVAGYSTVPEKSKNITFKPRDDLHPMFSYNLIHICSPSEMNHGLLNYIRRECSSFKMSNNCIS